MFPLRIALLGKTGTESDGVAFWGVFFASSLSAGAKSRHNPPWQRTQELWGGRQALRGYSGGTLRLLEGTPGYSEGTRGVLWVL